MGPCLGTHWEVDPDAGQALLGAVTLTLGRGVGVRERWSAEPASPKARCCPTLAAPHAAANGGPERSAAPQGTVGSRGPPFRAALHQRGSGS